jgi:hypothetical protein
MQISMTQLCSVYLNLNKFLNSALYQVEIECPVGNRDGQGSCRHEG